MGFDLSDDAIAGYVAHLMDLEDALEGVQRDKKEFFEGTRDAHGRDFVASLKLAVKTARLDHDKRQKADDIEDGAQRIISIINGGLHMRVARSARAREIIEEFGFDPSTGEVIETTTFPPDATAGAAPPLNPAAPADQFLGARRNGDDGEPEGQGNAGAGTAGANPPTETHSNARHEADIAEGTPRDVLSASLSPETATDTSAPSDHPAKPTGPEAKHAVGEEAGGAFAAVMGKARLANAVGVEPSPASILIPENAEAAPQAGDGSAPHVALSPASKISAVSPQIGSAVGESEGAQLSPANPPATEAGGVPKAPPAPVTDFVVFFEADADARCRKPDMCGSHSRLGVCEPCQMAWDADHQREAAE